MISAVVSPLLEASILSTRSLVRDDSAPAVTAGSGMARVGAWIFVAQDDSTSLAAIGDDGTIHALRLFGPIDGADRFLDVLGNKQLKPDMEAVAIVRLSAETASRFGAPARAADAVMVLGSGSVEDRRDHVAIVFPGTPLARSIVITVQARGLFDRLRNEPALVGEGQLNIEGAAIVNDARTLRLFNRGNGGVTASADVDVSALLEYLVRAKTSADASFGAAISNAIGYDLGTSRRGFPVSITDATVIRAGLPEAPPDAAGEILIVSAVAEETTDATIDGAISDTIIGLMSADGSMLMTPLMQDGAPASHKIEGLAVRDAQWSGPHDKRELRVRLAGITDPDATEVSTASLLLEIELVCRVDEPGGG